MAGFFDYLPQSDQMNGMFSGLGNWAGNNSNALIGLGAGIARGGNINDIVSGGLTGFGQGRQADIKLGQQNAMFAGLVQSGLTPQQAMLAILHPEFGKGAVGSVFKDYKFDNIDNTLVRTNARDGSATPVVEVPKVEKLGPGENLKGVQRGLPLAAPPIAPTPVPTTSPAYPTGAPQPYAGQRVTDLASGGPQKAPDGYEYVNPNDASAGLRPIAGGPATKLPANEAGILAMMQGAKQGVAQAREYFLNPEFKSWTDPNILGKAVGQATGSFDIGRHQRSIGLATESALRMMTGAAAPADEVKRYANFFTPSVYDSIETRTQKIDALQRFMAYAERNIGQGRVAPSPQSFMPGGPASGPPKDQGRISNPAWPPPPQGYTLVP